VLNAAFDPYWVGCRTAGLVRAYQSPLNQELPMKGFVADIEDLIESNADFRHVLYTGKHLQLVLMSLLPGEDIGEETHDDRDRFFRIEKGKGEVLIDGKRSKIKSDDAVVVPAGARHNIVNTGEEPLRLYTLYGPPNHLDGFAGATKAQAEKSTERFNGKLTEQLSRNNS
jgi:mannose-6-phosphate isomerase-like protein (cupin superfamily)